DPALLAVLGDHPLDRDLSPAAGCCPQVDHLCAGLKEAEAVVELDQLESRPRAIAQALRLGDIGIIELAFEPEGGRKAAAMGGLHPLRQATARAGAGRASPAPVAATAPPARAPRRKSHNSGAAVAMVVSRLK